MCGTQRQLCFNAPSVELMPRKPVLTAFPLNLTSKCNSGLMMGMQFFPASLKAAHRQISTFTLTQHDSDMHSTAISLWQT
jgi:hypothetical protein